MTCKDRAACPATGALALVALCSWTAPAPAQEVGAQVFNALQESPRVRVMVVLREPKTPVTSLALRTGEVASIREALLSRLAAEDFVVTHQFETISALGGEISRGGLGRLLEDPDVVRVDLDVPVYAATAESGPLIKADQVHNKGVTGRGVTVAVLDTGIDENHPDLKDSIVAEQCFCANADNSGCCPNGATQASGAGSAKDEQGHGTNVAGVITADGRVAPQGIAPDANIVVVRVFDKGGAAASTAQIVSGLDFILTSHPEVRVVNLSLATGNLFSGPCDNAASFTMAFAQAINSLRGRGTLVFASSGNNGNPSQIAAPACITNATAVGATYDANVGSVTFGCNDSTTAADRVACFSNASGSVDMLAPGAAITSAGIGGGTSTFLGTSQACPTAAAAAALLLSAKPGLSADQVEAALRNTGVPISDPRNGMTFRRIDVAAALASAP